MKKMSCTFFVLLVASTLYCQLNYNIGKSPLYSDFASYVGPKDALPEYPRPQFVREEWMNLNGLWDYRVDTVSFVKIKGFTKADSWTTHQVPANWTGKILVPFSIDAPLSGVGHILRSNEILWYHRTFKLPVHWLDKRMLLHFEASDWETSVYINGTRIGQHRGGYDPFTFDITNYLVSGANDIYVCVWDATEQQCQAIGKQIMPENRQGYRYQPSGGIWQSVWLEPVRENHIDKLRITPDFDHSRVMVQSFSGDKSSTVEIEIGDNRKVIAHKSAKPGEIVTIGIPDFKEWNPENPFLYDVKVILKDKDNNKVDEVSSYFGMRKIEIKKANDGFVRTFLNNKEIFQYGPLDQGYWPESVLTPPSEDAILFDLNYLKKINCNMVRVHIKTQSDRWYYNADKIGLLVWQDMICMPKYGQEVDDAAAKQWQVEFKNMVDWLYNHPSIVQWIAFNEAWSQHNAEYYTNWLKDYDTSRLVTCASGYNDVAAGDMVDVHDYSFYPYLNAADFKLGKRALVIGEAGGTNLPVPGHTWYSENNLSTKKEHNNYVPVDKFDLRSEKGRQSYSSSANYETAYMQFVESIKWQHTISGGNALVYTQLSDVEHELNGWLTYDRKISKIPVEHLASIHKGVYTKLKAKPVIPFGSEWKIMRGDFTPDLLNTGYNFENWIPCNTPVGEKNDFYKVKDIVKGPYVLQSTFKLKSIPSKAAFSIRGFTPCTIYLNGKLAFKSVVDARYGEPGIDCYPLLKDDLESLKKDINTILIVVEKNKSSSLLDAGFFIAD